VERRAQNDDQQQNATRSAQRPVDHCEQWNKVLVQVY
jgi:hypothetical protein